MEMQHGFENLAVQCKSCRCAEGDWKVWAASASDGHDNQAPKCPHCQVFKSGPLFISSKGLGWTSWKKRWFILTRTSLVFFRHDPNVPAQKGSEMSSTLGGIELNNSGSVVVRADKKLLTVLFPDGHDGRTFTLKAETSEDMYEWKTALEKALAQAPNATLVMGQNSIFQNDVTDTVEGSLEQWKDRKPVKSTVIGRPVLLALEDTDGHPSFLEKALRFIEQYGIKIEGILRQSADVEEVKRRVNEYEQGKNEFSPDEDAHLIVDCVKHILREMPASPVPSSCCTALVEAFRGDHGARVSSMCTVISEIFPEPNRCLLQRILKMMKLIASHKSENRMTVPGVAACMAPLLLRPLLAGDCEIEDGFDMGGDGSIQLLQAAAAANHAQAIVIILLEEYDRIFTGDCLQDSYSSDVYSESEDGEYEDDYEDDYEDEDEDDYEDEDVYSDNEVEEDDGYNDVENDLNTDSEDLEHEYSGSPDESSSDLGSDLIDIKPPGDHDLNSVHSRVTDNDEDLSSASIPLKSVSHIPPSSVTKATDNSNKLASNSKHSTVWGRTSAIKNLSVKSIDYSGEEDCEEEIAIERLEIEKTDLQCKLAKEVKDNELLQASLKRRKEALCERRLALKQEVERLQEQLQKERTWKACLEAELMNKQPQLPISSVVDKNVADVRGELNQCESHGRHQHTNHQSIKRTSSRGTKDRQANEDEKGRRRQKYGTKLSLRKMEPGVIDTIVASHHDDNSPRSKVALSENTSRDMLSLPQVVSALRYRQHSQKLHQKLTSQKNTKPAGISISSTDGSSLTGAWFASENCSKCKDVTLVTTPKDEKLLRQDVSSLQNGQPAQKQHRKSNSVKSIGVGSISSTEEPPLNGSNSVSHKCCEGEAVLSGMDSRNEKTQTQDAPSLQNRLPQQKEQLKSTSQNSTRSSKADLSRKASRCEKLQTQDVPYSQNRQPLQKQQLQLKSTSQNSTKSLENDLSETNSECAKTQIQASSLPQKQPSGKQDASMGSVNDTNCLGSTSSSSSSDELSLSGSSSLKKSSTQSEVVLSETACRGEKPQTQDAPSLQIMQPQQKQQLKLTSQNSIKSLENDLSRTNGENAKTQTKDSSSFPRKQPSGKPHAAAGNIDDTKYIGSATSISSSNELSLGGSSGLKKSTARSEETVSSSSALARLTNRLNFLKERRIQLANDLQKMDIGPPTRTHASVSRNL